MHLKTIKAASEIPFANVELVKVDKSIREVVIGGKLRIKVANHYSSDLEVLVEAPFETATRHRVTAIIEGFDPKISYFEGEYEAKRTVEDFEAKGAKTELDKVEVQIDDAGNVVSDPTAPAPQSKADRELEEIPF